MKMKSKHQRALKSLWLLFIQAISWYLVQINSCIISLLLLTSTEIWFICRQKAGAPSVLSILSDWIIMSGEKESVIMRDVTTLTSFTIENISGCECSTECQAGACERRLTSHHHPISNFTHWWGCLVVNWEQWSRNRVSTEHGYQKAYGTAHECDSST